MPTIKDIALYTGVSHGTVSNVLNKRGNVSVEKINLVENAARELGFKLNAQAKQLRQGQTNRVSLIMPRNNLKQYNDLYVGVNQQLMMEGYEVDIYFSSNLPYNEEELMKRVLSANPCAIVVVSSFLNNHGLFTDDCRFVFVERFVENAPANSLFIAFDYALAGKEIGMKCIEDGHHNVALFCGTSKYSNNKAFMNALIGVLESHDCLYKTFSADDLMSYNLAFDIFASGNEFDAIVTTTLENAEAFKNIYSFNQEKKLPSLYSLSSSDISPCNQVIKYELNYKYCGKRIAKEIIHWNETKSKQEQLILENDRFYFPLVKGNYSQPSRELKMLVLASPTSEALKKLLPSFTMQTGIRVRLVEVSYDELYRIVLDTRQSACYDVIRMDMAWLSKRGEAVYKAIDLSSSAFMNIKSRFSSSIPDEYFKENDRVVALPFDASVQVLYYRKDLFEDALIKREFYEHCKRQLTIPQNFKEYNEVAAFFTKRLNASSPTDYGTSLVFGSAVVAACDFLPRFKDLGGSLFDEQNRVLVKTQAMKLALENYIEAFQYTNQATNLWWQKAMEGFSEGKAAMNIVFANHASTMLHNQNSKVVGKIGFAAIPGSHPLLGGGVLGIGKESVKEKECIELLEWIYSDKIAAMITYLGGYVNNESILKNVDILNLYPWIEGMEKAFAIGWRRARNPMNPSFDEYKFEEMLGMAVRSVVTGIMNVDEALEDIQNRCDELFNH